MYDVAIIGGGPGGLSFAIHAENIKSIVIEEHKSIGVPVHCGECISDLCLRKFELRPPKDAIARAVNGVNVIFPGNSETVLNEKGYVLNKDKFEQYLADIALKKGAEIKTGARVENIERKEGYWSLKTSEGTIDAKMIVDASGQNQLISQLLNINKPSKKVIGIQYRMDNVELNDYLNFYLWQEYAPHGYVWVIPKSMKENGMANVGLVTDDIKNAKQNLDRFIKEKGWTDIKFSFGGMIPSSGPLKQTYYTGVLLVGDAAGFTSPLFEGGTHLGLMSGKLAAQVASDAVRTNDYSQNKLKEYEELWKKEFPPYDTIIKGKDALYDKLTTDDLEEIGKLLPKNFDNFGWKEKVLLGAKMMIKNPVLYKKNILDALFALAYSEAKYYGW